MPAPTSNIISISTGTILKIILILIALGVLWFIRDILLYIFIAILLAGLIYPFATWAARYRIPKGLAVAAFYIVLFGIIALAIILLIPAFLEQARNLVSAFGGSPSWLTDGINGLKVFSERFGLEQNFSSTVGDIGTRGGQALRGAFGFVSQVFGSIAGFFIVLVLSFYLVVEDSAIRNLFRNLVPERYQEFGAKVTWHMIDKLGAWLRGQLVLGLIIGALYFIGFSLIGVPYALLLAMLGGLLEFIPYIGPFIAAVPAVFLAFSDSPFKAAMTLVVIVIIQQLENNVIVPKVMQKAVGLNPVISIVAFMIGAKLFGVVGAIFAIPVATAISVAWSEGVRFRREHS